MLSSPIDNILVEKAKRQMHLRNGENVVSNDEIEEIYDAVKDGTPITIKP